MGVRNCAHLHGSIQSIEFIKFSTLGKMIATKSATKVSFCDQPPKVHEIDKVETYERPLIWWSFVDYARIRSANSYIIQSLRNEGEQAEECDLYCKRGLESWGGKESRERRSRIEQAVRLVLNEQKSQAERDSIDRFEFAESYKKHTSHCCLQARVRAMQDEESLLWERIEEEVAERRRDRSIREEQESTHGEEENTVDGNLDDETVSSGESKGRFARMKRRRSSEKKGRSQVMLSLKNFARKISASPMA